MKISLKTIRFFSLYFLVPLVIGLVVKSLFFNEGTSSNEGYQNVTSLEEGNQAQVKIPEKVDYIFHVKPILSDRCYLCHGPDDGTREAGLRLHMRL
jgi:hypothetical protein